MEIDGSYQQQWRNTQDASDIRTHVRKYEI